MTESEHLPARTPDIDLVAIEQPNIEQLQARVAQLEADNAALRAENERERVNGNFLLRAVDYKLDQLDKKYGRDAKTDLFTHDAFTEQFEKLTGSVNRKEDVSRKHTLLVADVDNFKKINEVDGHLGGDFVLRLVAGAVMSNLRTTDIAGRFGGDEMVVLLTNTTTNEAQHITGRIRDAALSVADVRLSIGLAEFDQGEIHDDVFNRADAAQRQAKADGKDRVVVYTDELAYLVK